MAEDAQEGSPHPACFLEADGTGNFVEAAGPCLHECGIPLQTGIDEVSLALVADAWSRTYRSRAVTVSNSASGVVSANGIRILPDRSAADWPAERTLDAYSEQPPAAALDLVLQAIGERYGEPTANVVAMQLEYPTSAAEP